MKMLLIALRAIRELEARFRCDWPAGHVCRGLGEGLLGSEFVVSRAGEAYDARARGPNPEFPDEAHKRAHMCYKLTPDHEESFSCNRPSRRKIRTSIEP